MTNDVSIRVGIEGDIRGSRVIKRELDGIAKSGDNATKQTERLEKQMGSLNRAANILKGAFVGLIASMGIRTITQAADQFSLLESRIRNSTITADEFRRSMQGLRDISMQTGASLESAVEVFQRLSFTRKEIQATSDEMLKFTANVQKLGIVSGASTQALNAGLTQLGQGLSSGVLRAEEMNSILENIPAVAVAIANEFGVTTGQLRNLVIEGEVLSKDVFAAILNQSQAINDQFAKMPMTIGRAFSIAANGLQQTTGEFAKASGASDLLVQGILRAGKAVESVLKIVQTLILTMRLGFNAAVTEITGAFLALGRNIENVVNSSIAAFNKIPGVDMGRVSFASNITTSQLRQESEAEAIADLQRIAQTGQSLVQSSQGVFGANILSKGANTITQSREISKNYADIAKNINDSAKNTKKATKEAEKLTKEIKTPMTNAVKDLGRSIENDLAQAFKDAFTGTEGGFNRLMAGMKSTFMNFLSEIAFQAAARPILVSLGVVGGGVAGGASAANAGGLGSLFSGSGGGISNLFSGGGIMSSLTRPIFSAGSSIGGIANSIGGSLGLMNNSVFAGGGFGPAAPISTAFTPMAGIAGFGGNFLANALFGNNRGMGATLGGTLGGVAGTALGASSLGAMLGAAGGPVGALAGAFLGNSLGGLFGGGGTKRQTLGANIGTSNGRLFVTDVNNKGASNEQARQLGDQIANRLNQLADQLGADLIATTGIETNIGTKDPGTFLGSVRLSNNKADIDAIIRDYVLTRQGFDFGSSELNDIFTSQFASGGMQSAINAVQTFRGIEGFNSESEFVSPLTQALNELEKQFNELKSTAVGLGLPIDNLTKAYEMQREAIVKGALSPLQDFLDAQALSGTSSLSAVERLSLSRSMFDQNLAAIQSGDLSGLGQLTNQASGLLSLGRDVFASGEGFNALESFVRQSISGVAETLGGSVEDSIARDISLSNAEQTSILKQMDARIEELKEENRKLRKSMERVGNAIVQLTS